MKTVIEVIVEVEIARPRPEVWAFVSDLGRLPEWLGEFESARCDSDGPIAVGSVVRYTLQPGHRDGTMEIVELEPGVRLGWDGPPLAWGGGAARPRGFLELADTGYGGTRLTGHFQPELTGTQVLLAPYLKLWLRRQRRTDSQRLKALLEASTESDDL